MSGEDSQADGAKDAPELCAAELVCILPMDTELFGLILTETPYQLFLKINALASLL